MGDLVLQSKLLINILLSVVLGFIIGLERKSRSKEAGVRTHTIVSLGSALFIIVSTYAFPEGTADTSRVAAQIVSGIGFLGAGMIVYRKHTVKGLTTAAGVWATAGIGMACGGGLYVLAVGATIILVGVQCILHLNCKVFNIAKTYELKITFVQTQNENEKVKSLFGVKHFNKVVVVRDNGKLNYVVTLYTDNEYCSEELDKIIKENEFITSIERCVEE